MKYNQPYGVTDPEAPYVNGNPSTGTMGSIPPAASIEHPQREVVNFLKDSNFTPDANDLRQMSKAVQGGKVNYCDDQGSPNFIAVVPTPPLAGYAPEPSTSALKVAFLPILGPGTVQRQCTLLGTSGSRRQDPDGRRRVV